MPAVSVLGPARVVLFAASPPVLAAAGGVVELLAVVDGSVASCSMRGPGSRSGFVARCAGGKSQAARRVPACEQRGGCTLHFAVVVASRSGSSQRVSVAIEQLGSAHQSVHLAPTILEQPSPAVAHAGTEVAFAAEAAGAPPPSVHWQARRGPGRRWHDLAGARRDELSLRAARDENGWSFRAVFTNHAGRAVTRPARLIVLPRTGTAPGPSPAPATTTTTAGGPTPEQPAPGGSGSTTTAPPATSSSSSTSTTEGTSTSDPLTTTSTSTSSTVATSITVATSSTSTTTTLATSTTSTTTTLAPSTTSTTLTPSTTSTTLAPSTTSTTLAPSTTSTTLAPSTTSTTLAPSTTSTTTTLSPTTTSLAGSLPTVTEQPGDFSTVNGGAAQFSAAASGSPAPAVQWQLSTDAGSSWAVIAGATAETYSFTASSSEDGYEYRAAFSNAAGATDSRAALLTVAAASSNWAGQDDIGTTAGETFDTVSGAWTVPAVSCSAAAADSSVWVGIDGGNGGDTVEQDGTEQDCENGVASYDAWYEMYGDTSLNDGYEVELNPAAYQVAPGDSMTASVSVSGTTWTLAIADHTKGWSVSKPVVSPPDDPSRATAEWIVERPEQNGTLTSLADFGNAAITSASAVASAGSGPASLFGDQVIDMVSNSGGASVLAASSPFDTSGEDFSVAWRGSS